MAHVVRRRPASPVLPAEPPTLHIDEPPLRVAGVFNPALPIRERCFVGDPKHATGTARHIVQAWVVAGQQRLLSLGRGRWVVWSDAERVWQALDEEAVEAWIYRALSANRWNSSPAHVAKIMKIFRLQLYWPPVEARGAA